MKMTLKTVLAGLALVGVSQCQAILVTKWTFETSKPTGSGQNISGISPEIGSGTASGFHASASTTWSNPQGNGSTESFSANRWAIDDYFQFQTSTIGYNNISIEFGAAGSTGGPKTFKLAYSLNGSSFIDVTGGAYALNVENWNATFKPAFVYSFDLSAITALDEKAAVYFRLINTSTTTGGAVDGGNVGTTGSSRVDDFTINGEIIAAVPEASTVYAGLGLGLIMLGSFVRKNRK